MASRKIQPSIGIDLGSSYCCVATWKNHAVKIIPNDLGERTTPSFVAFTDTEKLVGTAAKNQASRNAENTVFDIIRLIGRNYDEDTFQSDMKLWPFKIVRESNGRIAIQVKYKKYVSTYFPEEILSMILLYLKHIAEDYLGYKVNNAFLSVPVFFNESQRQSIYIAGRMAGLNILRVAAASTLASFSFGMNEMKLDQDDKNVLMFDLGGNSCDVSLLTIDCGVFDVKAVAWATNVGGKDFDDILIDYLAKEFQTKYKSNCINSKRSMIRLRTQCEKVKCMLSVAETARIEVDSLYDGIDFISSITRGRFEELCMNYLSKCLEPIGTVLTDTKMSKSDIDEIILIGGSTRIPAIQQMIKQYFNGKELCKSINPDESAAFGACVQAAILSGDDMGDVAGDILLSDCIPISLGIAYITDINADDEKTDKNHHDQTRAIPSDFAKAQNVERMVARNDTFPCKANETFTTYEDNQSCMLIQVYEGEHILTKYNKLVGQFILRDIPPAPKGVPQIEVQFDLGGNRIVSVSVNDKKNPSNNAKIVIDSINIPLTEDEIRWASDHLEIWAVEDEEKRETLRIKNELENVAYKMRNELMDEKWKDIINDNDKKKVQDAVRETIDWIDANPDGDTKQYELKRIKLEDIWKEIVSINDKNDEIGNNEELLRLELIKQKDIIEKLTEQNARLQSENNNFKNMVRLKTEELNNLRDDYKELEIKLKEKKQKYGYKSWDFNDVFEWIINIENERFKKYKEKLFTKLKEERIDGTCLEEMDANDLHRLGITQFKDKKALIKHIENLITRNKQNKQYNNDEGAPTAYL